jgi:hypothetical protein
MNGEQSLTKIEPMPSVMDEPRSPQALMRRATDVAGICREIVLKTACEIRGHKFVKVEGWESIATAHGCFAGAEDAERVYDNQGNHIGYKAKGVLRNSHGEIIATGEGYVGFDEKDRKGNPTWKNRAEYAGKAMAQTRAISRTCRGVFAHVVVLIDAGLSTTPAEEVPDDGFDDNARASRAKPANVPQPKPTAGTAKPPGSELGAQPATEEQRLRWIAELKRRGEYALGYCRDKGWLLPDSGPPDDITPGEPLEMLEARYVPTTKRHAATILAELDSLIPADQRPAGPQKPAGASGPPKETAAPASSASQAKPAGKALELNGPADEQPWFNAVVPVPYAGMKRDEYLKRPDTIGELYNLRHDDEQARRRLFGFAHNYEPKGWTDRQGKQRPPSKTDLDFRDHLDAFMEWFEANHPDEVGD